MKKIVGVIFLLLFSSAAFAQIQSVNEVEFEKQLIATKGEQLIDVRTPQEFAKYRIRSAKNINFKSADFQKEIQKLDKNKPVLIYCLSGNRSKAALNTFENAGFKTVYELAGGINNWLKKGKPIDEDLSGQGEMSIADYELVISKKGFVLVDFYAPWCGACRKMLPMVENLGKQHSDKFTLLTVDFDQNRLLVKEKNIKSVPYLVIFQDGKKVWEAFDETSEEELLKVLNL